MAIIKFSDIDPDEIAAFDAAHPELAPVSPAAATPAATTSVAPSTTTATPAVTPGAPLTPAAPLVVTTPTPLSPLDQVMTAYHDSYHKVLSLHVPSLHGAKGVSSGGGVLTGVSSILTGGLLGSYSPGAQGQMQKVIDDMTFRRTGIDYNATARVSDIRISHSNQIQSLSEKIRLCEELELDIDAFMTQAGMEKKIIKGTKDAIQPAGTLAQERGKVAKLWDAMMAHPITKEALRVGKRTAIGTGTLALVGAAFGLPALLGTAAVVSGVPLGVAALLRKRKAGVLPVRDAKSLNEALAIINNIRVDAEKKREELLQHLRKKCTHEITTEKSVRGVVDRAKSHPCYPELVAQYELLTRSHTEDDIKKFIQSLKDAKNKEGKKVFNEKEVQYVENELLAIFRSKSYNHLLDVTHIRGIGRMLRVTGPAQIGALVKRIIELHASTYQTGRLVKLDFGGGEKTYRITTILPGKIHMQEVSVTRNPSTGKDEITPAPHNSVTLQIIDVGTKQQVQKIELDVSTKDLMAEIASKNESDLWLDDPHKPADLTVKPDDQKKLLTAAKSGRLSVEEYKKLWASLRTPPPNYAQNGLPLISGIAGNSRNDFEKKMVDDISLDAIAQQIKDKSPEHDIAPSGDAHIDEENRQLLRDAQTEILTVPEYKRLWEALKPSPYVARNGLTILRRIYENPRDTFAQVSVDTLGGVTDPTLTRRLTLEIRVKRESDLIPGATPADDVENRRLLAEAQVRRLSVPEYKKLWKALKPPQPIGQMGLANTKKVAAYTGEHHKDKAPTAVGDTDTLQIIS